MSLPGEVLDDTLARPMISPADLHAADTLPTLVWRNIAFAGALAVFVGGTLSVPILPSDAVHVPLMMFADFQTATAAIDRLAPEEIVYQRHEAVIGAASELVSPASALDATSSATIVRQLHIQSGLTWEQLAKLFGVSRRAVHMWANGNRMNAANVEQLARLARLVEDASPNGTPDERRAALFAPRSDGRSLYDDLRSEHASGSGNVSGTPWSPDSLLGMEPERD